MLTRRDFAGIASCALCAVTGFIATDASAQGTPTAATVQIFNTSIRRFLKTLGVSAQREIEKAVREALSDAGICDDHRGS